MAGVDAQAARIAANAPKIRTVERSAANAMVAQNAIPALAGMYQLKAGGAGQLDPFAAILARLANRTSPNAAFQDRSDLVRIPRQDSDRGRRNETPDQTRDRSAQVTGQRHRRNNTGESSGPVTADAQPTLDSGREPNADADASPHHANGDGLATSPASTTIPSKAESDAKAAGQVSEQPQQDSELAGARAANGSAQIETDGRRSGAEYHGDTRDSQVENSGVTDGQQSGGDESQEDRARESRNRAAESDRASEPGRGNLQNGRANARSLALGSANPATAPAETTGSTQVVPPGSSAAGTLATSDAHAGALADAAMKTAAAVQASKQGGRPGSGTAESQLSKSSSVQGLSTSPLASHGDATATTGSAATNRADQREIIARVKLVQRVSKAFQHLGPEGGSIRLRLAPAELGSVRVEMQVRDHRVRARVVAETEAASHALREHLPDLRSRLESHGMQLDNIEVETATADRDSDTSRDAMSRWQSRDDQRRSKPSFTPPSEVVKDDADPNATVNVLSHGDHHGVDLRV